jgi:DNA polymerase III alpha subunit (gram-positive type)
MEELKTHQVHRLPTEDEIKPDSLCVDPIFGLGTIILKHGEECFYSAHSSGGSITTPWKRNLGDRLVNQHLYFTTDEEIKEGDWFYNSMNNIVVKATNRYSEMKNPIPHRKITASTDPKLETSDEVFHNTYKQKLPQIPQDFIKDY